MTDASASAPPGSATAVPATGLGPRSAADGDTFILTGDERKVTAGNLRCDYELRPKGFERLSLYDFVCHTTRVRCPRQDQGRDRDIDDGVEQTGPLFVFKQGHSQRTSHRLVFQENIAVPRLLAPKFPSRLHDPEKHGRFMLLLFKPFIQVPLCRASTSVIFCVCRWLTCAKTARLGRKRWQSSRLRLTHACGS
jgi:hypothetical protein